MSEHQREFFRIELYGTPVEVSFKGITLNGRIVDISAKGIYFKLDIDETFEFCNLSFQLQKENFTLVSKCLRKEELEGADFGYACEFHGIDTKLRSKIMSILLRLDAIRRNKEREERNK